MNKTGNGNCKDGSYVKKAFMFNLHRLPSIVGSVLCCVRCFGGFVDSMGPVLQWFSAS